MFLDAGRAVRTVLTAMIAAALAALAVPPAGAQTPPRDEIEAIVRDYLAGNPEEVQRIVRDYLVNNPEILRDALAEFVRRRQAGAANVDAKNAIKQNAAALFHSPRHVTVGNPQGDVTLVEFFDYNCSFCKRALADKLALMRDDPMLRIVLKELPVLGEGSTEAARVGVAVRMQDAGGAKYLEFHRRLLGERGTADRARALAVARAVGLDAVRLERDVDSEEARATLTENVELARSLGIRGTPAYVIGEEIVPGAAGARILGEKIRAARK